MQEEANLFSIQSALSLSGINGRDKMGWKLDSVWLTVLFSCLLVHCFAFYISSADFFIH